MKLNTCPPEIVAAIAIYLPLTEKIHLAATDKWLRGVIYGDSLLWSTIDFAGEFNRRGRSDKNRPELSDDIVESFLMGLTEKVRKSVRVIDLSHSGPNSGITATVVKTVFLACRNIRTLALKNCANVDFSTIATQLDTLVRLYPTLHLPNFTKLELRPEGRTSDSIIPANEACLKIIRSSLDVLKSSIRPPLTGSLLIPDQDLEDLASIPPDNFPCDLEECRCKRYYAAHTTACDSCKDYPKSHHPNGSTAPLCLVCQCFCDGCHIQYCFKCIRDHCESVRCLCKLKETAIMCYCIHCRPRHSCTKCSYMWCEDHLRRCTIPKCTKALCHNREDSQDCSPKRFMIFCQTSKCRESLCLDCSGVLGVKPGDPLLYRGAGRAHGWRFCAQCEKGVCGTCFEGDLTAKEWEHQCSQALDEFLNDEEIDDVENEEAAVTDEAEDLDLELGNEISERVGMEMPGEGLIQVAA
ncbi:hypothetical protein BC937DRAFT_87633 [Endogone sp. FLAS-F59071]|nr:hypothetical protein BC937DRAFT_87633 [Endogone sp. FLAS-F59071]|eukprot:RUS22708.1 hypothetical protein BC937DRAFT_87633 [Endogone sp. FLAS-F59071]